MNRLFADMKEYMNCELASKKLTILLWLTNLIFILIVLGLELR